MVLDINNLKKKITVIGAGYMGSAITYPLTDNGFEVNLVGTWLDNEIIKSSKNGYHPKLKKPLQDKVSCYYWEDMPKAVNDCDIIFIGVLSEGFVNVFKQVLDALNDNKVFFKLTKGIVTFENQILRATQAAYKMLVKKFPKQEIYWATIGGPVKAFELSEKIPTATIYALSENMSTKLVFSFSTDYYPVTITGDIAGVEVSSAFKNVYSIAIGICDGLFKPTREGNYHNLNAFLFNQACLEMSKIAKAAGGIQQTVFDIAGIGDFYAASISGRNRRYGEYVGLGEKPDKIYQKMFDEGEVAEGYKALELGIKWVESIGLNVKNDLPLLETLYNIVFKFQKPLEQINLFVRNMKKRWQGLKI